MPSSLVHMAVAALIAAAILDDRTYDLTAVAIVALAVGFLDMDAFVGLLIEGGHRSVFHTLLLPGLLGLGVYVDDRYRSGWIRQRWGGRGLRIAWVSLLAIVLSGIGLDLFTGGANILYPIHDQFYAIRGKVELSSTQGIIQTFWEVGDDGAAKAAKGSTETVHISTGVDPKKGPDGSAERVFPVVRSGWQLLMIIIGVVVTAVKCWGHSPSRSTTSN